MAQSTLTISSTAYNINIQDYSESNSPIIAERTTIPDPDNYSDDNTVLIASGNKKHTFTITGQCSISDRSTFLTALKANTKVYPVIYPNNGSTNVIETSAYYYITEISGNFKIASSIYYYNMSFVYGGS